LVNCVVVNVEVTPPEALTAPSLVTVVAPRLPPLIVTVPPLLLVRLVNPVNEFPSAAERRAARVAKVLLPISPPAVTVKVPALLLIAPKMVALGVHRAGVVRPLTLR